MLVASAEWVYAFWFFWIVLGSLLLVVDGLVLFLVPINPSTKILRRAWSGFLVVVPLLILAMGLLGLLLPFVKALEGPAK
jgi:hypothetical protein